MGKRAGLEERSKLKARAKDVGLLATAKWPEQYPEGMVPEVAFAGRSNVGKSSLINALLGQKGLARVSRTPGKTQLIHFYKAGDSLVFVDLPGYGYAKVSQRVRRSWGPMVERYLLTRQNLRLILLLLDARRVPGEMDMQLKAWLEQRSIPYVPVVTKIDKISSAKRRNCLREISGALGVEMERLIPFSALTLEGKGELWRKILEEVGES